MCIVTPEKGNRVFNVFQIYLIIKSLYPLPSSSFERVEQRKKEGISHAAVSYTWALLDKTAIIVFSGKSNHIDINKVSLKVGGLQFYFSTLTVLVPRFVHFSLGCALLLAIWLL